MMEFLVCVFVWLLVAVVSLAVLVVVSVFAAIGAAIIIDFIQDRKERNKQ